MNLAAFYYQKCVAVLLTLAVVMLSGCATAPYRYTTPNSLPGSSLSLRQGEPQIERGQPIKWVDSIGNAFGIPTKLILWNRKMITHSISPQTEQALEKYLQENQLTDVKVRINQYAPGDEWHRLVANKRVGAGYRYTVGALTWLGETILPNRVFASSDYYNPMTNTINIYSDLIPVVIHEAGHAKDFTQKKYPGTYAIVTVIPGVNLYHEAQASNDAMSYFSDKKDSEHLKEGYKTLYPAYGSYVGGNLALFAEPAHAASYMIYYGSIVAGHIIGRHKAAQVEDVKVGVDHCLFGCASAPQ